jgi:hypothetical protein
MTVSDRWLQPSSVAATRRIELGGKYLFMIGYVIRFGALVNHTPPRLAKAQSTRPECVRSGVVLQRKNPAEAG